MIVSVLHTHLHHNIFFRVFRVQFALAWPSWSSYSRVVDDGFPVLTKHRCVDSEQSHIRLSTFDRFSSLFFISHFVIYNINHAIFWLRESRNKGASTMETAMTLSNLWKSHIIMTASYSIISATYWIHFRVQHIICWPYRVAYSPASLRTFSSTIYISLTIMVDVQPCCRW